tara:strand:+ start:25 stop:261 length:237 start_codon:yes stop_codon:yes gene_type:complete
MKKLKFIGKLLLPILLAFIPFGMALELVNQGEEPTAIIVGLLTPSILALFILIKQTKNDYDRKEAIERRKTKHYRRKK